MARSLNQAFIKAYSKDAATPKERAMSPQFFEEDFILRIDTVSVPIPELHLDGNETDPRKVAATHSSGNSAAAHAAQAPNLPPASTAFEDIRDSIADQMVRATEWRDMPSEVPAEMPAASSPVNAPSQAVDLGSHATLYSASIIASGGAPQTPFESQPPRREQRFDAPNQAPNVYSTPGQPPASSAGFDRPIDKATRQTAAAEGSRTTLHSATVAQASTFPTKTPSDQVRESIAKPVSQALSSAEIEQIVERYAEKHGRRGEIFRLDRPSYSTTDPTREDEIAAPLVADGGSLVFEESQDSHTSWDLDEHQDAERAASIRATEEALRESRMQVFNPVWEVDRLQWPQVCVELIRQREESLTRVAQNLTKACAQGLQLLAVTSPLGGEGRTTVACCLAKLAAVSGLSVAFVDGDLDNPSLAYQTNLELESDWREALENALPLEEIAVHSIEDQVTLIPLLDPIPETDMTADDQRIVSMLKQLTESFDLVIVDTGPVKSARSMATSMSRRGLVNAVITVVDNRLSNRDEIEDCLQQIRRTGVSSVGLVENFAA